MTVLLDEVKQQKLRGDSYPEPLICQYLISRPLSQRCSFHNLHELTTPSLEIS